MIKITMSDLVQTLRKAAAHPEKHARAQLKYFSLVREDSVLVNCGTACCVAGDLMLKAHADEPEERIGKIIYAWGYPVTPSEWVKYKLGLTGLETTLAFDANTHYRVHSLLADLLEQGLRLPDVCAVGLSCDSNYVEFDCAFFDFYQESLGLEELLDWMREIAVEESSLKSR
jgi:hypothetical protein